MWYRSNPPHTHTVLFTKCIVLYIYTEKKIINIEGERCALSDGTMQYLVRGTLWFSYKKQMKSNLLFICTYWWVNDWPSPFFFIYFYDMENSIKRNKIFVFYFFLLLGRWNKLLMGCVLYLWCRDIHQKKHARDYSKLMTAKKILYTFNKIVFVESSHKKRSLLLYIENWFTYW